MKNNWILKPEQEIIDNNTKKEYKKSFAEYEEMVDSNENEDELYEEMEFKVKYSLPSEGVSYLFARLFIIWVIPSGILLYFDFFNGIIIYG